MNLTQGLCWIQLLKLTAKRKYKNVALFIFGTTVKAYSPNYWKPIEETIIKFIVETLIDVYRTKDRKFKVETTEEN